MKAFRKPKAEEETSNTANAGVYLFNTSLIADIELRPHSLEREIFPKLIADGQLHQILLKSYWRDLSHPKDFLAGSAMMLEQSKGVALTQGRNIEGNVLIHPTAKVADTA